MQNFLILLLEQPIVRYAILLYLIWLTVILISKIEGSRSARNFSIKKSTSKITEASIISAYVFFTFILLYRGLIPLFPYLNAIFLGIVLWFIIKVGSHEWFLSALLITLIPYVIVTIFNSYPLGDDARFTAGFAIAIANEGRWIPYKYHDNDYYQLFHAEPALTYIMASVMGVSLNNIPTYYLLLKYSSYLLYTLNIYMLTYNLVKHKRASYLSLLLFSITPPLALTQIIAQGFSILFSLLTLNLVLKSSHSNTLSLYLIASLLAISGTIFHATYMLVIALFLTPLALIKITKKFAYTTAVRNVITLTLIISITYIVFSYAVTAMIPIARISLDNFINFLLGTLKPYTATWIPWYDLSTMQFLISWSLLPSLAGSILTYRLSKHLVSGSRGEPEYVLFLLSLIGLVGTFLNFLARQATLIGGRYFYWLYLFFLPLTAYFLVTELRDKIVATIMTILVISWISVYGIEDPTYSANTFITGVGWADNRSWEFSQILSKYLPSTIIMISDPRIETPLKNTLRFLENINIMYPKQGQYPQILILGTDAIGYKALLGAESYYKISLLKEQANGTIMYFGIYKVDWYGYG
jgi:hypothetical protein